MQDTYDNVMVTNEPSPVSIMWSPLIGLEHKSHWSPNEEGEPTNYIYLSHCKSKPNPGWLTEWLVYDQKKILSCVSREISH